MTERLSRQELDAIGNGFDPVAARSWSINTECYRDPKYLQVEREQIFLRTWQFLCHEEKLRQPGSYVVTDVLGQSVFASRDTHGELRAFYNVCKHRGHELLKGEGSVRAIACPYHAWVYDLDGSLRRARCTEHIENFDKDEMGVVPMLDISRQFRYKRVQKHAPVVARRFFMAKIVFDVPEEFRGLVEIWRETLDSMKATLDRTVSYKKNGDPRKTR